MEEKTRWKKVKEDFKTQKFWVYFLGMIISLGLFLIPVKTFKIIGLGGFFLTQLFYLIKEKSKSSKVLVGIYALIFLFYLIIYISMSVGETNITAIVILAFFFSVLLASSISYYSSLRKSKKLLPLILTYLGLAMSIIILFGGLFILVGGAEEDQITNSEGEKLTDTWDYIAYSASNFYSNNFGEIPSGKSRLISNFELAISFIIHIIILGEVITNLKQNE